MTYEKQKRLKYVKNIRKFKHFLYSNNINWRHFWRYYYLYTAKEGAKTTIFTQVLDGHYGSVILHAFPWSKTKEGHNFWQRIGLSASNYF